MRNRGHKVNPMSVNKIRDVAELASQLLEVSGAKVSGERNIIDILDIRLPKLLPTFSLVVLEDWELPNEYARTYPEYSVIQVRESVYEGARSRNSRDRFTLAHEIGHLFLHRGVVAYARSNSQHKPYEDSEWQADAFAAEFLMPYDEVMMLNSVEEIMERFNVSYQAASHRWDKIKKR
jgi:Zn-dependent peptidase ImmA (M78 family)